MGYRLPDEHEEGVLGYICLPVPVNDEYRQALFGTLTWPTKWFAWERTGDDRGAIAAHYMRELITPVIYDIRETCGGDECEDCGGGNRGLPDCITIDSEGNIHVEGCKCMGNIYIYNGCCSNDCGCGQSGGGFSGGNTGTGGVSSQPDLTGDFTVATDRVTLCDTATTLVPYLLTQFREFMNSVDSTLDSGGDLIDFLLGGTIGAFDLTDVANNTIEFLADMLAVVAEPSIDVFEDSDFRLRAQEIWWATFGDRTDWSAISREDIRLWAGRLPIAWGQIATAQAVSPRLVAYTISQFIDMTKVNNNLLISKNTRESGLCEYLASQNGQTYEAGGTVEPPPIVLDSSYWLSSEQIITEALTIPGGNDPVNQGISSILDNINQFPGIIGFYVYGTARSSTSAAGASYQIRRQNNADIAGQFVLLTGAQLNGVDQPIAAFVGPSGLETLWDFDTFTYLGDITQSALSEPTPTLTFGPYNNWPPASLFQDLRIRYLIDSSVQAP